MDAFVSLFGLEAIGGALLAAGSIVLILAMVALGAFAYKSLSGDGIEWPEDRDGSGDSTGVTKGGDDDEWEYY